MSRIFLRFSLAGSLAFIVTAAASAQSEKAEMSTGGPRWGDAAALAATLGNAPASDSTYAARALRLESSWGNFRIVRGADGPVLGKTGLLRTVDVEKIVAGSRRAESEARLFQADHRPGSIVAALGALTFVGGVLASAKSNNNAATPALMVAGGIGMIWGARKLNSAYTSLSRAIWWYNRDLVAGPGLK